MFHMAVHVSNCAKVCVCANTCAVQKRYMVAYCVRTAYVKLSNVIIIYIYVIYDLGCPPAQ